VSDVICYYLEQIPKVRRYLRRYRSSATSTCPTRYGYCNAQTLLDEQDYPVGITLECYDDTISRDDPRWPKFCPGCGKGFADTDEWQVNVDALYRRSDTGAIVALGEAEAGAMWDAYWWRYKGPDGKCLVVKLPNGHDWIIDGPSQQHKEPGAWTRTGTPPLITASPSILADDYHGWLRNGILSSV
jgi:hypothetical protein